MRPWFLNKTVPTHCFICILTIPEGIKVRSLYYPFSIRLGPLDALAPESEGWPTRLPYRLAHCLSEVVTMLFTTLNFHQQASRIADQLVRVAAKLRSGAGQHWGL